MIGDIVICALLILFCLFCLFDLIFGMGEVMQYDPMGPKAWPIFLLTLLLILLTVNIILTVRKQRKKVEGEGNVTVKQPKDKGKTYKLGWAAAGLFVYITLMDKVGFICSTPLFIGYYMTLLENRNWKMRGITAVASTAALYILFSRFLQVPLPRGYGIFRLLALFLETL